jgi:hypothetical protein
MVRTVAEALNGKEVEVMRKGFRMKALNFRVVHWVDPTGKPEFEFAAKNRKQADAEENAGFQRFASIFREVAEYYVREAVRIIWQHKLESEERA